MNDLLTAAIVVIGVPAVLVGYIVGAELILTRLVPERRQGRVRPWLWIAPALAFLTVFLIYPTINTLILSFQDRASRSFVGLANYEYFFTSSGTLEALRNSLFWVVFMTLGVVGLGLLIAILVDRVRYESIAKSVIFVPLAISFVAAGVIWSFMYLYRTPGTPQVGTLNAALDVINLGPVNWTQEPQPFNNLSLIFIGIWMWTGFAMVILSAGLKGISAELLEASRVDGANEWQVFRNIILPLLMPTIFVVGTTIVITALKSFDIVFTVTNGNHGTDVIARRMWAEMFTNGHFGRASAVAIVLLLTIIPFMALNIKRFREQEAVR